MRCLSAGAQRAGWRRSGHHWEPETGKRGGEGCALRPADVQRSGREEDPAEETAMPGGTPEAMEASGNTGCQEAEKARTEDPPLDLAPRRLLEESVSEMKRGQKPGTVLAFSQSPRVRSCNGSEGKREWPGCREKGGEQGGKTQRTLPLFPGSAQRHHLQKAFPMALFLSRPLQVTGT